MFERRATSEDYREEIQVRKEEGRGKHFRKYLSSAKKLFNISVPSMKMTTTLIGKQVIGERFSLNLLLAQIPSSNRVINFQVQIVVRSLMREEAKCTYSSVKYVRYSVATWKN